ncbi:MAG: radical SAM family heme chaperone HemW [Chloroflexi bacterium]|nr:radical SAM family heme chaperone HemW [Chloroflexota bacterium]
MCQSTLKVMYNRRVASSIGLFIFIPFCKIKCTYCDFNVYAHLARLMEPYADAVTQEIRNSKFVIRNSSVPLRAHSIYFGGGTPSIIPAAQLEKILRACRDAFDILPDAEITLEANPATADAEKMRAWRAAGIHRLSIGVQAFDDATLKRLNRGHTVADALEMFELARRAGFDNLNLDFIYGLPLQSLAEWRATLTRALELQPEHLSLYALRVEEKTGLEFQITRGKYSMPDDDLAADMYEMAEEMLDAAGYGHYEISNWAMRSPESRVQSPTSNLQPPTSKFQSRHNLTYWLNEPYLGFGAGAHSSFGGARFSNVLSPAEYIERIARGASAVAMREEIPRELEMAETMFLGLRLIEGIALERFRARFDVDARAHYADQFAELWEMGLIEFVNGYARLSVRGRFVSNEVFWRFLPDDK